MFYMIYALDYESNQTNQVLDDLDTKRNVEP